MYTASDIWNQSKQDDLTAHIEYPEMEASILYGIRLEKVGGRYEFFVAYEGDFYRKLPSHFVNTIIEMGWRKGLCQLLVDRCERNIESLKASIERQRSSESPEIKTIERLESTINNLIQKQHKYSSQI